MIGELIFRQCCLLMIIATAMTSAIKTDTGCQGEFQEKCRCGIGSYRGFNKFITNCTNTGFKEPSMLRQLPIETEVLIFTGNNIESLPPNLFGNETSYTKLTDVDLSNNNISKIQGKAFHRIPNVKRLILNNNRWNVEQHTRLFITMPHLEELHLDSAFYKAVADYIDETDPKFNSSIVQLMHFFEENPLLNLKEIHLENNKIGPYLDMEIFSSLPKLESIFLSNNRILQVLWNESVVLPALRSLDLSFNYIPYLLNDTLHNLDHLPDIKLNLSNNNFICDCRMTDFYNWLHETDIVDGKEKYKCQDGYPEDNTGQLILNLQVAVLQCERLFVIYPNLGIAQIVLIMVVVLICALLFVVAFVNRRVISHTFRRFSEPLYRRMQYSTIQKQAAENEIEI